MKEKLKVFNFSDEEIIRRTKEAHEKNAELEARLEEAMSKTIIIPHESAASSDSGNIVITLIGMIVVCVSVLLFIKAGAFFGGSVLLVGIILIFWGMSEEELNEVVIGAPNGEIFCPHCNEKGNVHTKNVKNKKGVSGGKATAALITGGVSMLATGLSRKEKQTEAHCTNCNSTWTF